MAELPTSDNDPVARVFEAVVFENWLRFTFIAQAPGTAAEDEAYVYAVPEADMARIRQAHPELAPLAEYANGQPVDFDTSRRTICRFVLEHLEGSCIERGGAAAILEDAGLTLAMQLFGVWIQANEEWLDRERPAFATWLGRFAQWRDSPNARELAAQLANAAPL